ncbi:MAG: carbohydrate porin, partial [Planctomycetota bacterium]|nr:carbohydrate porin [Planctomycetota bacterium]
FALLDQDPLPGPLALLSILSPAKTRPDDWGIYYNFDQYLYTEEEDPTQGVGLFGRFGWNTGDANPFETFYSVGVGGKGIVPKRDNDTFGLGYYYLDMSDDIPALANQKSEQGVELYYNFEVTPWLHITPDLQVIIDPGGNSDRDVAIAAGVRAHVTF